MIFSKQVNKLIIKTMLANEANIDYVQDDCCGIEVHKGISIYPYDREVIHFRIFHSLKIEYSGTIFGFHRFSVYYDNEEKDMYEYSETHPIFRMFCAIKNYTIELLQEVNKPQYTKVNLYKKINRLAIEQLESYRLELSTKPDGWTVYKTLTYCYI